MFLQALLPPLCFVRLTDPHPLLSLLFLSLFPFPFGFFADNLLSLHLFLAPSPSFNSFRALAHSCTFLLSIGILSSDAFLSYSQLPLLPLSPLFQEPSSS